MYSSTRKTASAEAGTLAVASRFGIASQQLLRSRGLLCRNDTKFVVPAGLAVWVLARVAHDYKLVMHGPSPLAAYTTDYYDTAGLQCFFDEIRGETPRYKVRVRSYQDGNCFIETKATDPNGLTHKHRLPRASRDLDLSVHEEELINATTSLSAQELTQSVGIDYDRLTLVSPNSDERVTVDVNIVVRVGATQKCFPEVAIFESKRRCHHVETPIIESLALHGIEKSIISKYCCALALIDSSLAVGQATRMLALLQQAEDDVRTLATPDPQEQAAEPLSALLGSC